MTETPDARECARKAHAKMEDLRQKAANLPSDRTPDMSEQAAIEEPKYTESDMRVLTEAALRLGRAEAAEEIAAELEMFMDRMASASVAEQLAMGSPHNYLMYAVEFARSVAPQGQNAVSEPRTGLPASPSHPKDSQAAREAL